MNAGIGKTYGFAPHEQRSTKRLADEIKEYSDTIFNSRREVYRQRFRDLIKDAIDIRTATEIKYDLCVGDDPIFVKDFLEDEGFFVVRNNPDTPEESFTITWE